MTKIISIIVVKNEADILPEHLAESALYFDFVAYLDNGSTDRSYSIATNHPSVCWAEMTSKPFQVSMRGEVMHRLYDEKLLAEGDWVYLVAPDHSFESNIIMDVEKAEAEGANCISYKFPCFCYTDLDYLNEQNGVLAPAIKDRLHYYTLYPNPYNKTIVTAMRYSRGIHYQAPNQEPPSIPKKKIASFTPIQGHYRFRSEAQIRTRLEDRRSTIERGTKSFRHYDFEWDWRRWVLDHSLLCNVHERGWQEEGHLSLPELRKQSAALQKELFGI